VHERVGLQQRARLRSQDRHQLSSRSIGSRDATGLGVHCVIAIMVWLAGIGGRRFVAGWFDGRFRSASQAAMPPLQTRSPATTSPRR